MRKSRIHFDGETDRTAFLERTEELQEHFAIPPNTMLTMLPEILTDKALQWYRNNRARWYPRDDFVEEFRDFYLPNYDEILEDQIVNRRQRPGEAVVCTATCCRSTDSTFSIVISGASMSMSSSRPK